MPGRSFTNTGALAYRYGFNGKENDNDVKGEGNQQDYGMRIYDPRIGKFLSVDPITANYPELTPYQFASNSPIQAIDLDGLEAAKFGAFDGAQAIKQLYQDIKGRLNKESETAGNIVYGYKVQLNVPVKYGEKATWGDVFFWGAVTGVNKAGEFMQQRGYAPEEKPLKLPQQPHVEVEAETTVPKLKVQTATITRVQTQHALSQRISVTEAGDAKIVGKTKLYITIDDTEHVKYYYNKKGGSEGGASVVTFQVKKEVADEIRKMAVPQAKAGAYPDRPEISDPTKSKGAFGLPANYIDKLQKGAIKGTGKVETPK